MSRIFFLFLFLPLFVFQISAQNNHESQLKKAWSSERNPNKKFMRLMTLGKFYQEHNIERADSIRHVILKESRSFPDSVRFKALFFNAEVAQLRGDQDEYYRTVLECQPFLNLINTDEDRFLIFRHLGYYHSNMQEFEQARFYLDNALKISQKHRDHTMLAEVSSYIALNFMLQNQKDSALVFTNKAIMHGRRSAKKTALTRAFNTQARVYDYFGQVELSVAKNLISLQLAEEERNILLLAQITREIGKSEQLIQNLNDAENFFNRSRDYASQIHDKRQMALALSNLASVQLSRAKHDEAIRNANRSIKLLSELNDFNGLGEAHNILGMVHKEQKDYIQASSNFNQALVYYESTGNKEKIAGVYHNVGTVFQKQKKYKNALNYLNRSIEIREQFGSKNQIYHTYRVMADVYKDVSDNKNALKYMELYLNYMDSNTTIQAATKIAELSESYRSEQRERFIMMQADSIERQRQERTLTATKLENSQLRNTFQTYIIIAFVIIIVLAGFIIFFRWNHSKIKQQQREAEMSQTLLRTQMNPHFVFNAMSVIQSYIFDNDIENSSKFLVNFSRLMRLILENSPKEFIPIKTEVEILQKYLAMQKLRFQERFDYQIFADNELLDEMALIPPMITQPFIENAIEHGQLHTIEGGFIHITFSRDGHMLVITIEDNGIGRKASRDNKKSSAHKSMALEITRERIDNLNKKYRTEGYLLVEDYNKELETGTKILISLPYKVEGNF